MTWHRETERTLMRLEDGVDRLVTVAGLAFI